MALTQLQPFNLDNTGTYVLGSAVVTGAITTGGSVVAPSVLVTQVQITDSSYVVKDDTAVLTTGGYIKITGSGFSPGINVIIGSVNATSVTFISSTVLHVQVPAMTLGTYTVYIVNSNGSVGIKVNGLTYSGTPTWVSDSVLAGESDSAISIQLSATGDAPVVYALAAGSTLPTGLTLSSGGLISGTVIVLAETVYNFNIEAIDAELQESPRAFSITITTGDIYFNSTTLLLSGTGTNNANNNTFLDSSTNNLTITRVGNTTQGTFSPYSPAGWSVFFNGSTDFFNSSGGTGIGGTAMAYGTGDFTWEMWLYPTSSTWTSGNFYILDHGQNSGVLQHNANQLRYYNTTTGTQDLAAGLVPANTWTHVAVCRISGTTRIYINGVVQLTKTGDTYDYGTSVRLWVARYGGGGYNFPGYISNLRLVKGLGVYTGAFTPSTTPLTAAQPAGTNIAAITNQTSLLICQDNSFINDSFVPLKFDGGTTLAIGGTPRVTNWSPFKAVVQTPLTYSNYFDGTGDYLSIANNAAFNFSAGDFTVELWFNFTSLGATSYTFAGNYQGASAGWELQYRGDAGNVFRFGYGNSVLLDSPGQDLTVNAWYHLAASRNGTSLKIFLNGVQIASTTDSTSITSTAAFWIGGLTDIGQYFVGYISNVRIVKGTAVYTAAFTPPTQPLTAVTNTSLLTCQSATFVDNSANKFTITAVGNSQPVTVNPFGSTFVNSGRYTIAEYGGSMYFDGTGDYLRTPEPVSAFQFGGEFTIECWVYTSSATSQMIFDNVQPGISGSGTSRICFFINANLTIGFFNSSVYNTTSTIALNAWNHLVLSRTGSTMKMFINGVEGYSATRTANYSSGYCTIGLDSATGGTAIINGYISNLRVIKGQALYTSNFVPPLAPVLPVTNTVLLLNGTNAAITDATTKNVLETVGDARISTAVSKFGGSSMAFDGTGDYLTTTSNPTLRLSGNFTMEAWVYLTSGGVTCGFISTYQPSAVYGTVLGMTSANMLIFRLGVDAGGFQVLDTTALVPGTWYHVAGVRNGNTLTLYKNGVSVGSVGSVTYTSDTTTAVLGRYYANFDGFYLPGYMQDARITTGIARYTANFTPLNSAFPNI